MPQSSTERKMGIEEELMLIDPDSGRLRAVSHHAMAAHREQLDRAHESSADEGEFGAEAGLEQELFLQQIETGTAPSSSVEELTADVRRCRRAAAEAAEGAGAALVAVGAPVLGGEDREVTPKPRYQRIVGEFGEIGRQGSVCGMHVHVDVSDKERGVQIMDSLRAWLPVLRALSVNSPYWYGVDTGYASWRTQVWGRWPSAGPSEPFGDLAGYRRATESVMASGAALDPGMLYLDARPSDSYPTLEVRVFDVVTEIDDISLIAALTRALIDTVDRELDNSSSPAQPWRTDLLRAAHWLASRDGLSRGLLDPVTRKPTRAREVIERTIEHCHRSLELYGDSDAVTRRLEALLARGTGATRQRGVAERAESMEAVVADLQERFRASWEDAVAE